MIHIRANQRLYVRPILSSCKSKKSIRLSELPIFFDKLEIIKRQNHKISKKIISLNEISDFDLHDQKIISEKINIIKKPYKKIKSLSFKNPQIMGILNVTPDSFSDGGKYNKLDQAVGQYKKMVNEGAEIIDIGGESTRPGSNTVSIKNEINRLRPFFDEIRSFRKNGVLISLDTRKSEVAEEFRTKGINIVNDVSGLRYDNKMLKFLKKNNLPFILMHSISSPSDMQNKINYNNVLLDVYDFFENKIKKCNALGIKSSNIILDPGIGFGKTVKQNLSLIKNMALFHSLGCPLLLGSSRKSFIGKLSKNNLNHNRIGGSIASVIYGLSEGVRIFRVHDVHETKQAIKLHTSLR